MPTKRTKPAPKADPLDPVNVAFGAAVKAARERRGLTYRDAAEALGVAVSGLQKIEAGSGAVTLPVAARVATGLGVSIDKVLRAVG